MLRLLLIAPTIDGEDVGEAWVAHQWVRRLAERHEATVLTYYKRGATPASRQLPGVRVIEWAEPPGLGRAERLNSMMKPAYLPFYARARRWIRTALAHGERFDLAHQPVPVAMRYPSPVAGLGIPYLIGPVGGSLASPPAFAAEEGAAPWYTNLRAIDRWRVRRDPLLRRTYSDAACVLGIADYVADFLDGVPLQRFEVTAETGIEGLPPPVDRADRVRAGRDSPLRLLFVGRMVRTKGARDVVRALSLLPDVPVTFDVIGDGYDRPACEELAKQLGVSDQVTFHGRLPRPEIDAFYAAADVFAFPSYREPGGNVAFEAMSFGLPLIVSDVGGPGNVVDASCGMAVHPQTPDQYARDVAAAIRELAQDGERRLALGEGARRRVADIALWDRKIDHMSELYRSVLESAPS